MRRIEVARSKIGIGGGGLDSMPAPQPPLASKLTGDAEDMPSSELEGVYRSVFEGEGEGGKRRERGRSWARGDGGGMGSYAKDLVRRREQREIWGRRGRNEQDGEEGARRQGRGRQGRVGDGAVQFAHWSAKEDVVSPPGETPVVLSPLAHSFDTRVHSRILLTPESTRAFL